MNRKFLFTLGFISFFALIASAGITAQETQSIYKLDDLLDVILPLTTTNIQESEIFNLLFHAPSYLKYERVQCRVPQDGTYNGLRVRRMAVLGVDFNANINYLRDNIYPEQ